MRIRNLREYICACGRALCAALALFALLCAAAGAETDGMLRVKLARLGSPASIGMRADCDYWLAGDSAVRVPAGTDMTLSANGGALTLSAGGYSVELGASAELVRDGSGHSGMAFTAPALSNRFCGDLCFTASAGAITTVLRIYVEDYLYGVVGCEMPPSSGIEALKAQAVVARNYALRQKAARTGSTYDLSDAGDALSFRGYSGASEYADAVRAVGDTKGQALYYGDRPATCYFCDSNGGQTESSENALGEALPYSAVRDDPYDLEGSGAKKTATLRSDAGDLAPALAAALLEDASAYLSEQGVDPATAAITAIEDIEPESPRYDAPSRLYRTLAFDLSVTGLSPSGEEVTARVTARAPTYGGVEDWYGLSLNDDDNETVWVSRAGRAFEITFRRSGSGLGMSQRGAQVMARKGFSYETILDYYYPGTALRTLELSAGKAPAQTSRRAREPIAVARLGQKRGLYPSADDGANAVTTLPAGTTVDVYAVEGDWAAVGSGEVVGFIHTDAFSSFSLAGVDATPVGEETPVRLKASADLLQLPVSTALALMRLNIGDTVNLLAYTDDWALVAAGNGTQGFVPSSRLTPLAQDDGEAAEEQAAPEAAEIDGGAITVVRGAAYLYVDVDSLPLYERWSEDSAVLDTLERGERVRLGAYNEKWACVRVRKRTGFVLISALTEDRPKTTPAVEGGEVTVVNGERYAAVKSDDTPLYPSWSTDDEPLSRLSAGTRVQVGAYNAKWVCVRVDGQIGFIPADMLQPTE